MAKKINRTRDWMLTIPEKDCSEQFLSRQLASYRWCGQLEQGQSGYRHWQVFIMNKNPIAFDVLKKKFPTAHLEPRRGSQRQCFDYVTKKDSRVGEPLGDVDGVDRDASSVGGQGGRSDLEAVRSAILLTDKRVSDLILDGTASSPQAIEYAERLYQAKIEKLYGEKNRDDLEVHYLWGDPGVGKTRMIHSRYPAREIYEVSSYKNPFDGYSGQSVLVLDEFHSQLGIDLILKLIDIYPFRLPARFHDKVAAYRTVWIVSNEPISSQFPDVQRDLPRTWRAFLRRFNSVSRMLYEGEMIEEPMRGLKADYPPLEAVAQGDDTESCSIAF